MALLGNAQPKPLKGEYQLERKTSRKQRVSAEQTVMRAATKKGRCIVPKCEYRDMPIDPCHVVHRGMGGNPKGDRTTPDKVFPACRIHHSMYDRGDLEVKPLHDGDYRRECAVSRVYADGRKLLIGISEQRGA